MIIIPAIDMINGKVVRLFQGDYSKKTEYELDPVGAAESFERDGATNIHLVDLDGAKAGEPRNFETVKSIVKATKLFSEVGGGIRNLKTVDKYISNGVDRVILGTAALENEKFLDEAVKEFGNKIAVGVDIKDCFVAINGWTKVSKVLLDDFMKKLEEKEIDNVICTDISRDGAMRGTNLELYKLLAEKYNIKITASGGVSSISAVEELKAIGIYGAIIGKALYSGDIKLAEAVKISQQ